MGEVIKLSDHIQLANGGVLNSLKCARCGGVAWVNFVDDDGCVAVMACYGVMEDGVLCGEVIDLNDISWEEVDES